MKLRIFQSDKGDCLLLEGGNGGLVLCDGGMAASMKKHVRAELAKLRTAGRTIDFAYVSHIDQDHISGVLQLLEDELEWRLFDFHAAKGTPIARPKLPRPPQIGGIWHNGFRDMAGQNHGKIENLLAAATPSLLASGVPELMALGAQMRNLALSIPEAIKVSRYASPDLLGIPINKVPGAPGPARLLMVRPGQVPFNVGSMAFTIVGPTAAELTLLRKGWNNFLELPANRGQLTRLRAEIKRKVDAFGTEAFDLGSWNGIPDFEGVTTPNIASLMFMVEEGGKRLLLTGDSQQDIIIKGLEQTGYLAPGHLHLDVLKVQHHGSEHNVDVEFCRKVSADHYVFCGNGSSGNPELKVIQMIYDSRLGPAAQRALAPQAAGRPFKFWFSTTSAAQNPGGKEQAAFRKVETLAKSLKQQSGGKLSLAFNKGASVTLQI